MYVYICEKEIERHIISIDTNYNDWRINFKRKTGRFFGLAWHTQYKLWYFVYFSLVFCD